MKYKLSDIMDIIGGGTPKTSNKDYWNGNIPWLSVKDFNNDLRFVYKTEKSITKAGLENSSTKLLEKNDIIISARGTVGELAMISYPMAFNQSCYGLRANEEIVNPVYLYYLIKHNVSILKKNTHGSVFDTITRDTFDGIETDVPSLAVQEKIAVLLADLDDKIELNNAINNNLSAQARAIFLNYFVNIASIPDGWQKGCLLDIANYLNGLAMQKYRPHDDEEGLPVLKIKELRQGSCDESSELCSPNIKPEYIISDGDVVFSWSGSLLIDIWCGGTCGLNQHLFKVTSDTYDKWFYYLWTSHHLNRFIAIAADKATTMGHIKREDLAKAEVFIPSETDYKEIGAVMKPLLELIISNRLETRKLTAIRDELLPKLLSGEIDVSEVVL